MSKNARRLNYSVHRLFDTSWSVITNIFGQNDCPDVLKYIHSTDLFRCFEGVITMI